MLDAIKPLLDSDLINEETRQEISEAWEAKLNETREQVRAELREEFAQRYEHDKHVMVEALDRMVTDALNEQIESVKAEKQALAEDRVKFQTKMKESAVKFNDFMVSKLAEEITELRKDRNVQREGMEKLEKFIVRALAEEISEFHQDKQSVIETKVKLVSEARSQLDRLKTKFVSEASRKLSRSVSEHLRTQLTQLHEDIQVARENNFGRRIFEAFAAEFGSTHLNENAEMRKLMSAIAQKDQQLAEATKASEEKAKLVEQREKQIRILKESNQRAAVLEELLGPLNEDKREVMRNLLESVQTSRLKTAFEKYLPAVLAESGKKSEKMITESVKAVTGDKTARAQQDSESNVVELKRLAGLN